MIAHLVKREFTKANDIEFKKDWLSIAQIILKVVFLGAFIALECFIFVSLNKKINEYSPYGAYDFLILYNFVACLIISFYLVIKARKTLFDEKDNKIMMVLPVSSGKIVFSKVIWLYCVSSFYLLVLGTPSLICYASALQVYSYFYIFAFAYPLIVSFFTVGLALILVPVVEIVYRLIKNFDFLQFILATLLVIGLCFAYQFILNLFLTALSDSSVGGMFDLEFINKLHKVVQGFIPISHLLNPILGTASKLESLKNISYFVTEIICFSVVGLIIVYYSYSYFNYREFKFELSKHNEKELKLTTPFKELLRKEFMLLFRNKGYIFSYTSLLIMAPFLSYVVISSLNSLIYSNLSLFSTYFPELINGLNIVLILLFIAVINSSASLSVSREEKMIQIVKYIPVSSGKQISAKLIPPLTLSLVSLVAMTLTLFIGKQITLYTFAVSLFLGAVLVIADNLFTIEWDMHDLGSSNHRFRMFNILLSIGFPTLILIIHFALALTKCNPYIIYGVEAGLGLLLLISCFIRIKYRYKKAFNNMEVN